MFIINARALQTHKQKYIYTLFFYTNAHIFKNMYMCVLIIKNRLSNHFEFRFYISSFFFLFFFFDNLDSKEKKRVKQSKT